MKKFSALLLFFLFALGTQAQNFKYGKVSKDEVMETSHPDDKDANAAVLLREQKTYFEILRNFEFSVVTEVHERIKIYTKDGFDWANKEIFLFHKDGETEKIEELEAVTYNIRNGKLTEEDLQKNGIFEEKVNDYNSKVALTMPAVVEGSVIELKYKVRSPFWSVIDKVALQETVPVNKVQVSVAVPGFFGYKLHFNPKSPIIFEVENKVKSTSANVVHSDVPRGRQSMPSQTTGITYEENVYIIEKEDIPALRPEAHVGYLPSHAASVEMELQYIAFPDSPVKNYALTWEGVAESIYKEGKYQEEISNVRPYEEDLKALLKGVVKPEEKARAIYKFVKEKVKWNGYYGFITENGIRKAYKDGEGNVGDINVLLTSMMNYAGLEADPVLLSTEKNGIPLYPTRNGFNYVICSVNLLGQQYLLDATEQNADFGELPARARNWRGRRITDQGRSDWVDLMPKKKSTSKTVLNLTFDEDLALTGKTVSIFNGLYAKSYRDRFSGMAQDSYLPFLESEKRNIEIADLLVKNENAIGTDIQESFNFVLKDELQNINGRIYFQPLFFERIEDNPFKAESRTLPIYFDFPKADITMVNIKIPEGYAVESIPESAVINFGDGDGSYRFMVIQNGQYLRVESQLEWNHLVFTPEAHSNMKEFYNRIVEKNSEAIVLKKL